jgi:hypothetical protein
MVNSTAVRPASSCFSTPIICSVFSFRFDIFVPLPFVLNHTSFRANTGDQVTVMADNGTFECAMPTTLPSSVTSRSGTSRDTEKGVRQDRNGLFPVRKRDEFRC